MNRGVIIAFFVVLAVSGVFSMFGKGGGSLYTPVLVLLGWGVSQSISTALFLNLVTALVATIVFTRNKLVDFKFSLIFLPGTITGSILGALLSSRAPKDLLLGIFAVFLLGAGVLMILSKKGGDTESSRPLTWRLGAIVVLFSFAVGVLSSLIGVGGGLIIFPFLVLYMKYSARMAAGANAFIVTVSSIVGTIGHFAIGHVEYLLLGVTAVAAAIGSAVGSRVTVKASPSFIKIAFAFIMWFFAVEIILKLLGIM
ncbi:MAG TPA: sulfite exporter TauE/SafE family protein [Spirochaetota bacterium]|nr:sulfite exporter TauE/SafE family protein [Spirochaetota bacterium]HPC42333.1 sulfite exporter TauE/SafE family protein [Spirochaetota bacterium]HPL17853.1 sulfite exporter TauE/SafE family protein [Spirochaetota bacterium]HQF10218.1 sulfite exporter TauE/SafE family protein [Spirochaetota bacterium]HQH99364.1 sulfite exporter TauE/SafE family protein [Spirochaetota bacterium]